MYGTAVQFERTTKAENWKKKRPTRRSDSDQARGQKEKPARETRRGQKHEEEARQADRIMPGKEKWKTRREYGWYRSWTVLERSYALRRSE